MRTYLIPVFNPNEETDTEVNRLELTEGQCREIVETLPKPALIRALPNAVRVAGFRDPINAPRALLMKGLKSSSIENMSLFLGCAYSDARIAVQQLSEENAAQQLGRLVAEHGMGALRLALMKDERESIKSLASALNDLKATSFTPAKAEDSVPKKDQPNTSSLQRQLSAVGKELKARNTALAQLRSEKGELERALGDLRSQLAATQKDLTSIQQDAESNQVRIKEYEQILTNYRQFDKALEENQRFSTLYGEDLEKLRKKLVKTDRDAHDADSRWTALCFLLEREATERAAVLKELETAKTVPLAQCVQAITDFLDAQCRSCADDATDAKHPVQVRIAAAQHLQDSLKLQGQLRELKVEGRSVAASTLLGDVLREKMNRLRSVCNQKITIDGVVRCDGENAWIISSTGTFGVPSVFTEHEQLLTGDHVSLTLYQDPADVVVLEPTVLERVERTEINDVLHLDDQGFYVSSLNGTPFGISESQLLQSNVAPGTPIQVIVPQVSNSEHLGPIYARLKKELLVETMDLARPAPPKRERKTTAYHGGGELLHVLGGQAVLVVGGDGLEGHYQSVVEGLGGRFLWQSGFDQINRTEGKTHGAHLVVLVTSCIYHSVRDVALQAATKLKIPVVFFNSQGKSSFTRFMLDAATRLETASVSASQS